MREAPEWTSISRGQQRLDGFSDVLIANGLDADCVRQVTATNDIEGGRKALRAILDEEPRPSAIFTHHDVLAAGVLLECHSQGIEVPKEMAVVGFDDSIVAEATRLTSVRNPFEESGRIGARLLDDLLSGASESLQHVELGFKLVVRDTT